MPGRPSPPQKTIAAGYCRQLGPLVPTSGKSGKYRYIATWQLIVLAHTWSVYQPIVLQQSNQSNGSIVPANMKRFPVDLQLRSTNKISTCHNSALKKKSRITTKTHGDKGVSDIDNMKSRPATSWDTSINPRISLQKQGVQLITVSWIKPTSITWLSDLLILSYSS